MRLLRNQNTNVFCQHAWLLGKMTLLTLLEETFTVYQLMEKMKGALSALTLSTTAKIKNLVFLVLKSCLDATHALKMERCASLVNHSLLSKMANAIKFQPCLTKSREKESLLNARLKFKTVKFVN